MKLVKNWQVQIDEDNSVGRIWFEDNVLHVSNLLLDKHQTQNIGRSILDKADVDISILWTDGTEQECTGKHIQTIPDFAFMLNAPPTIKVPPRRRKVVVQD
jgi:hypothetical protein